MTILGIAIIVFLVLESLNILMLYFTPGSKMGNGVGVFNAYEESKKNPRIHSLVSYLVNWVAGTKLIFVGLLLVILFTGSEQTQLFAVIALILSILSFFWRLFPTIKRMDKEGELSPKGYSKTLGIMIGSFVAGFSVALLLFLIL
ncbi:MAG TPA: hypothetical protein P5560_13005 [Thermotogota bacterium]|nr:hypothetical protein [Thermotogota bacterium]HRW93864.1 hypothetical protein [Thermotogota bacterium]